MREAHDARGGSGARDMNETDLRVALTESGIPEYMHESVLLYLLHRLQPGHFLTAVLENNLEEACGRADDTNRHALYAYVYFLYNFAPTTAWGSPEKVSAWLSARTAAPV